MPKNLDSKVKEFAAFLEGLKEFEGREAKDLREREINGAFDKAYHQVRTEFYKLFPEYKPEDEGL